VRYGFIKAHDNRHSISDLCRCLCVSRSGYYAWRSRPESSRVQNNKALLEHIRRIHASSREAYGAVKTWHILRQEGIACGRHRVARLRWENGIEARRKRRFRISCRSRNNQPPAPNHLKQVFHYPQADQAWVGDTTFIPTRVGRLYLAVMLDLYSRRVVGWAMSERNNQQLVAGALSMAIKQRRPDSGLIHHSDQGATYASAYYREILSKYGLISSMSRKGNCHDNAVAESFFANLKNELVHHCNFKTREEAKSAIFDYIELFYNRNRIHAYLEYQSPVAFESTNRVP